MLNSNIDGVVTVFQVENQEKAIKWYEKLLGRKPDIMPNKNLVEWYLSKNSWLQITSNYTELNRVGRGAVMINVHSLEKQIAICNNANIEHGKIVEYLEFIKMFEVVDPDGNKISFLEDTSDQY